MCFHVNPCPIGKGGRTQTSASSCWSGIWWGLGLDHILGCWKKKNILELDSITKARVGSDLDQSIRCAQNCLVRLELLLGSQQNKPFKLWNTACVSCGQCCSSWRSFKRKRGSRPQRRRCVVSFLWLDVKLPASNAINTWSLIACILWQLCRLRNQPGIVSKMSPKLIKMPLILRQDYNKVLVWDLDIYTFIFYI